MSDEQGDPHADWPDRTTLADATGDVTVFYSAGLSARDSIPWADGAWISPTTSLDAALVLVLHEMAGWIFSTSDPALAQRLLHAGAVVRRHAHSMSTSLKNAPGPSTLPAGLRIEPLTPAQVDRHALALGALNFQAYPPDHPDAFEGDEAAAVSEVRAIARGELLGPMAPESRIAVLDHAITGACMVVERPGEPPYGGPWVIDLFRDPRNPARGIGAALLAASMAAAREARLPGLSLVVSHGNDRARRLYERLDFKDVEESWTLVLPKKDERPS